MDVVVGFDIPNLGEKTEKVTKVLKRGIWIFVMGILGLNLP